MLDELAERYGDLTVITVSPYVGDDGETLRWVVVIDGEDVPDMTYVSAQMRSARK